MTWLPVFNGTRFTTTAAIGPAHAASTHIEPTTGTQQGRATNVSGQRTAGKVQEQLLQEQ